MKREGKKDILQKIVQRFITDIKNLLSEFQITFSTNAQNWFFPCIEAESNLNALIVTIAKQTIFRSKHSNRPPNAQFFINLLKMEASKEKGAAVKNGQPEKLLTKWGNALQILDQ